MEMKPEDAINLLDQICAQVTLTREVHDKVKEAVESLRNANVLKKEKEEG